ncbi:hypothetical protein Pcinc_036243 [Petrolisthes cinctipes]|uniref:Uncharacterized protein n=1 Tax=Petrolisthes cinctipes TaxID=88211 RepID=A0AAE1BZ85_PETCI|nr:hypothetical protein Pcinc_036243 [Petrolisthes cinctipes]
MQVERLLRELNVKKATGPDDVSPQILKRCATLVVFHKALVQEVPHLAGLCQPPRITSRVTRTVTNGGDTVEVPHSHSSQHQRTFVGHVSRMWNIFTTCIPNFREMNTQGVKLAAHKWRGMQPTPLTLVT